MQQRDHSVVNETEGIIQSSITAQHAMRPFIRISWLLNIVILLDLVILTVEMNSSLDKLSNAQALPFIIFKMMNVAW